MDTYTGSALKFLGFEARISDLATEGPKAVRYLYEKKCSGNLVVALHSL
jgi:hypothetical protein